MEIIWHIYMIFMLYLCLCIYLCTWMGHTWISIHSVYMLYMYVYTVPHGATYSYTCSVHVNTHAYIYTSIPLFDIYCTRYIIYTVCMCKVHRACVSSPTARWLQGLRLPKQSRRLKAKPRPPESSEQTHGKTQQQPNSSSIHTRSVRKHMSHVFQRVVQQV